MPGKAYFISDLHLGAGYISSPREHERRIVAWLESIASDASHLFMLGDVLDYWYEYRKTVPRGYIRFFGALARLADAGVEIVWLTGNHDIWLFDYLRNEIGLKVVDGEYRTTVLGKNFLMEHGDGVGKIKTGYRLMRKLFRNRTAQWLYAAIHPRWTIGFAQNWSKQSRKASPQSDEASVRTDMVRLTDFAEATLGSGADIDYFVFGHLHIPASVLLSNGHSRLVVLGDCFTKFVYGEWDGTNFMLKNF